MNTINNITYSFTDSLYNMWNVMVAYLPSILGALAILFIGYIIASFLGGLARKGVRVLKLDDFADKLDMKNDAAFFGISLNLSKLVGWFVKWFIFLAAIIAAVDVLNIHQLSVYMQSLVLYIPNVLIAMLILAIGIMAGNAARAAISSSFSKIARTRESSNMLGRFAKIAIVTFSFMAAMTQLGIAANLIEILFAGFVAMLAIAGGLAFGLGGKEHANELLRDLKSDIRK